MNGGSSLVSAQKTGFRCQSRLGAHGIARKPARRQSTLFHLLVHRDAKDGKGSKAAAALEAAAAKPRKETPGALTGPASLLYKFCG